MSNIPTGLKYSEDHEWVSIEGDHATIGISDHAQSELGDLVFVEVDGEVDDSITKGDQFGSVESVKSVSDIIAPISGTITEINEILDDQPEILNEDPYEKGWLVKIKISDLSELDDLLSADEYAALINN